MKTSNLINLFVALLFLFIINWWSGFTLIVFDDLFMLVILIIGVLSLTLLSVKTKEYLVIRQSMRLNLFGMATLMSIVKMFDIYRIRFTHAASPNLSLIHLKPLLYAFMLYIPLHNWLGSKIRFQDENNSQKGPFMDSDAELRKLLSRREYEVCRHLLAGLTNKEISEALYIAESTVKKHIQNILKKLDCQDRKTVIIKYKSS